jgi:hypothetical protein
MDVVLADTTLRDGAQQEGISLSVEDKVKIGRCLDRLGIAYIQGGWPGSNPEDMGSEFVHSAADLNGPVNALDRAVHKAPLPSYPALADVHLTDDKVRIPDGEAGTSALTRVLIDSSDGERMWSTVGSSPNIIEASWQALADSLEYALLRPVKRVTDQVNRAS